MIGFCSSIFMEKKEKKIRASDSSSLIYTSSIINHTMMMSKLVGLSDKVKKAGVDDPRRIVHSLKVGLALTVVSLIYYVNPIYNGFGISAIWAVITVVFVMEFTVGGTLGKGVNRAVGTFVAGALGVGTHYLAALSGGKEEPVILACFVFLLAAAASFSRFIPEIKARYDYGVLIFILTFSLVAVSSYRVDEIIEFAHQRLSTVAIGGAACMIISVFLFPVWAGGELHHLTAINLQKLSMYLEGLESEYFDDDDKVEKEEETTAAAVEISTQNRSFLNVYKAVLNSKAAEESLANLATWEPAHGGFRFRHPWMHYLKIGALARQCACCLEALNTNITRLGTQISSNSQKMIKEACRGMCSGSSKALKGLSKSIRTMTDPSSNNVDVHLREACDAVTGLQTIQLVKNGNLSDVLHAVTVASVLAEVIMCTQNIAKATGELSTKAHFISTTTVPPPAAGAAAAAKKNTAVTPISDDEGSTRHAVVITVDR